MPASLIPVPEVRPLQKRGITQETCAKFDYGVGTFNNKPVQVAQYRDKDGNIVAQHLRTPDKEFVWLGDTKHLGFFGQHLWREGGKRVIVTEGEIDCLSISQLQGNKWPVVSVPNGAQGAKKTFKSEIEWLERFETVVLCFDMDEPGRDAAQECAAILSPGKVKIARLPLKDANEMLQAQRGQELISALWDAKEYRPDGIISLAEIKERAKAKVEVGLPWPWPKLTELTYGRRRSELYAFGAGTGIGKTDVFTQIIAQTALELNLPVGIFYLEQPPEETAKRIAGKAAGKRFHVPGAGWSEEELFATLDKLDEQGNLFFYDHFGVCDWDTIKLHIRYLAHAKGVKDIFLDHLTALATGREDRNEKEELERIMAELAQMAQELQLTIYFISHLTTPEGKPHEEGGRVMIRHFKGSRAIGFWSHFMFGLERDQQAKDESLRQTTTFRVLKDRYTGQATGKVFWLGYDHDSGLLSEAPEPKKCPFPKNDNKEGEEPDF